MILTRLPGLPPGLAETPADHLADVLDGPTLLHLPGEQNPPLFVSVLLHGNEVSGWQGLRRLLQETPILPRSLIVFIGNVAAAAAGLRTLPDQPDYNRIWRAPDDAPGSAHHELADEVKACLDGQPLFAAVDLHNNTGHNPHYAVVTNLTDANLALAYEFSDKAVYIEEPDTVLTRVFDGVCPSLALELGPIGDNRCEERAHEFLHTCMNLPRIPDDDTPDLALFRTIARVHVDDAVRFGFTGNGDADRPLMLTGGVEAVNFHELAQGTEFGIWKPRANGGLEQAAPGPLKALDTDHRDVTADYFDLQDSSIRLQRAVVPAMYTTDPLVIAQDCLCYFMERLPLT